MATLDDETHIVAEGAVVPTRILKLRTLGERQRSVALDAPVEGKFVEMTLLLMAESRVTSALAVPRAAANVAVMG